MRKALDPSTLLGALLRLARLRPRVFGLGLGTLAFGLGLLLAASRCEHEHLRVVTFNIEDFPKSETQVELAFRTLAGLDAPVVAVQEIMDREAFADAAASELGSDWEVVVASGERAVGLLFDSSRVTLRGVREHEIGDPRRSSRSVLEARLRPRDGGPDLRVFVVHLEAMGGPKNIESRARQLAALTPVVAEAAGSRDEIIVLGDFNSTDEQDRANLRRFAARTGLTWASEQLECTAYWNRRSKDKKTLVECPGSALDHVFTRRAPRTIAAKGVCEDLGCDGGFICPVSRFIVSDHCPVLTEL